jgi:ABC-type multidrug transport system fused ATPase/permease subunit
VHYNASVAENIALHPAIAATRAEIEAAARAAGAERAHRAPAPMAT